MEMHLNVDEQPMAPINQNVDEQPMAPNRSSEGWPFSYFTFDDKRDSPGEVRNAILVVAALFAAASFQGMMSPPDTVKEGPHAIKLIFTCFITLSWSSSAFIIIMLTDSFPFQREIFVSYVSMSCIFGLCAASLGGVSGRGPYIIFVIFYFLPMVVRWGPACIKRIC